MFAKSIVLVRTQRGVTYATTIANYLEKNGQICFMSPIVELEDVFKKNNLVAGSTLIHSRTAGPRVNEQLANIESRGFKIVNAPRTLNLTNNKYLSQQHAREMGIPVANTYKIDKKDFGEVKKLVEKYGTVVVKPIFSQGQGIFCSKITKDMADNKIAELVDQIPGDFIQVQQYINYKKLIRVIVIGYKALVEAMTYDEPNDNWKCSVCLNPMIKKYNVVNPGLIRLAEDTAKAFGAQINFIDFFEDEAGEFILNEINTACSLTIHEDVTGVPIHKHIGDFLVSQLGTF